MHIVIRDKKGRFIKGLSYWTGRYNERKDRKGETHGMWKGDNVKYRALHMWVERNKETPTVCNMCGKIWDGKGRRIIEWANISGEYKRDLNDWEALCHKCHSHKDNGLC